MVDKKEETLIEHLEALRTMLIRCLLSLAIGLGPIFFITPYVMDLLIRVMMAENEVTLNFFSPMEVFILQLKIALVLDILFCFPYMAREVWRFVAPALYQNEQDFVKSIVLTSSALFIIGVLFCLFFILPMVIRFGLSFVTESIKPVFGIGNIVSLALWLSLVFGAMFQFPLITYALIRSDIVGYETMKSKRTYIFVGILIISGLLTPPDIISQLLLTIPTYGLFEIGLFFGKRKKIL
ncbi:MAG: twin-arginine translocase subunit TatC [Alphaproteobacteria bacterium]|nr:twin-arginine translocase subunit TatC [Alphaproteobacteria bacterium]